MSSQLENKYKWITQDKVSPPMPRDSKTIKPSSEGIEAFLQGRKSDFP
jgi:hypothetical protein